MNSFDQYGNPFALVSQRVVLPGEVRPAGLVFQHEKFVAITTVNELPADVPVTDLGSSVVSPGMIDAHVHINEPGHTKWEGFTSATKAAAAGGITCLVDMPLNSLPVTTSRDALLKKHAAAEGQCWIDVGFYGGLVPGSQRGLRSLVDSGVIGIKVFLCDSGLKEFPAVTPHDLDEAMPLLSARNIPLLVHAELVDEHTPASSLSDLTSYQAYLASRPSRWEVNALRQMIELSQRHACPVHIVHLATSEALPTIDQAKSVGTRLTVATCPHYLRFASEEIPDGDPRVKCAPPIRESSHRTQLWDALRRGTLDTIGSDHSPCPPAAKCLTTGDLQSAWGGIAGLQFSLPSVWSGNGSWQPSLVELSRWMSTNPAKLIGFERQKGSIEVGKDADLVVWNAEASNHIDESNIHHRHKITPYQGLTLQGVIQRTYVRGNMVYDDGRFASRPIGKMLQRGAS